MENKISTRRYGRLLAVLILSENLNSFSEITEIHLQKFSQYLPVYEGLPPYIQQKICSFATELILGVMDQKDQLIATISQHSKNRPWAQFQPLDRATLLVGLLNLQTDPVATLIVKEMLIVSDLLANQHAVPYISGILKSIVDPRPNIVLRKNTKIKLKKPSVNEDSL